jgi:hypothetical protein
MIPDLRLAERHGTADDFEEYIYWSQKRDKLLKNLVRRLLMAYHDTGETVENYYNNIILPELTEKEIQMLKHFSKED